MRTYVSSRVKRKPSFYRKSEIQKFLLISGGHIGGQFLSGTNMASPSKALQRCVKCLKKLTNNSETVGHKDLRFGQIFYILGF